MAAGAELHLRHLSALCALNAAGVDHRDPVIRKAVDWLVVDPEQGRRLGRDATSYRLDYKGFEGAPRPPRKRHGLAWTDAAGRGRASRGRAWRGVT